MKFNAINGLAFVSFLKNITHIALSVTIHLLTTTKKNIYKNVYENIQTGKMVHQKYSNNNNNNSKSAISVKKKIIIKIRR